MNNNNMPDVGNWTVNDMGRATGLISNVLAMLATETMISLMSGELRRSDLADDGTIDMFREQIDAIREDDGDESVEQFAAILEVMTHTCKSYMGDLMKGLADSGLVMPDPDNVTIPDTVPDDLGRPT